jgi:hypothetical protein
MGKEQMEQLKSVSCMINKNFNTNSEATEYLRNKINLTSSMHMVMKIDKNKLTMELSNSIERVWVTKENINGKTKLMIIAGGLM